MAGKFNRNQIQAIHRQTTIPSEFTQFASDGTGSEGGDGGGGGSGGGLTAAQVTAIALAAAESVAGGSGDDAKRYALLVG